ncbi:hypothetical protein HYPSUDRAFT_114015, partial [Hypholoma sublateritium FD-334 SS-4]
WDASKQKGFETRLAKLTASAGLPLSWVDNPNWTAFLEEYVPLAQPFDRKALTNRIIPKLVTELREKAKSEAAGNFATVQADGWTGMNHRHLIAFMITADKKVYTVRVYDASVERKTAENFLHLLEEAVKEVEEKWKCKVIAVVTDASGECRKARQDFVKKYPWIVVLDCFAHQ